MTAQRASVLIIYTGGTIGMVQDLETGSYKAVDFDHLAALVPELSRFDLNLNTVSFEEPMDSSDMTPDTWVKMAQMIQANYDDYDGFVILHGSDTMAYSASALSFMLEGLQKPVILTGAQLPIGVIRSDGKENLITAIELASAKNKLGEPRVPEVAIYFEYNLYRGCRTVKVNAEQFEAFQSPNYPELVEAGVHLNYNRAAIKELNQSSLVVHLELDPNVALLKLFPGLTSNVINALLDSPGLKAVVLETYGSGNANTQPWFLKALQDAIDKGIVIINITQCNKGSVEQGRYATSTAFDRIGVVSGYDITTEAAITKLMFLLGMGLERKVIVEQLNESICGEVSFPASN
jgi:L-asparaginase